MGSQPRHSGDNPPANNRNRLGRIVLLAIFAAFLFLSIIAYTGWFNSEYVHSLEVGNTSFAKDRFENYNPTDLTLSVIFKTAAFSAQNPIKVEITAFPSPEFNGSWYNQEEKVYALFVPAYQYPLEPSAYIPLAYKGAMINLTRIDSPQQKFYGEGKIVYHFPGNYTFYLVGQDWIDDHTTSERGLEFHPSELEHRTIRTDKYFIIESSEQTSFLRINNLVLLLTFVLLGFTFMEFREHIVQGLRWLGSLVSRIRK